MKSRFAALKTSCATLWYSGLNTNALVVGKVGKPLDLSEMPECEVDQAGHIVEAEAQVFSKLIVQTAQGHRDYPHIHNHLHQHDLHGCPAYSHQVMMTGGNMTYKNK